MALCSIFCPRIPVRFRPKPISPFLSKPLFPLSYRVYSSLPPTSSTKGNFFSCFGLCLHMVFNCHKSCCFSEPWVVLPMLRKMFGSQSRISPFWLVLCLKNGCFIYDRWTWKCKHWVSGYGNHGFSYGTKPPQSWVTLFCLAYLSYLQ